MEKIKWHYVPGCKNYAFYDTGAGYHRVVDTQTGEIVFETPFHDDAFTWILRKEYPVGSKFPVGSRLA